MAKNKEMKEKSKLKTFITILVIICIGTSFLAMYEIFRLETIENLIRYIVIGTLGVIDLIILFKRLVLNKKKKKKNIGFITFMIFYTIICGLITFAIYYLLGKLDNMNKNYVTYSSSLVIMNSNQATKIDDIKNFKLAILNDEKSPDGYIIPQEIIKDNKLVDDNEIVSYEDYSSMLTDLYIGEITGMFVPTDYPSMFSSISGYENISSDTRIIITKEKKMKKSETSQVETASSGKLITEPFTMLLMGIDSTDEVLYKNAVANGDTLILLTFNPKTLNATMLSIPRDSYVPIACWSSKAENKITHAAGYGNDCMMNTIQQYFGINIDYYAKINFKGLVKLVDSVGGVEVNVAQKLCTDDSSRYGQICISPGYQTLNGEQALVYARNRKALVNGDFGRNQHQQEIVMALANKVKTITDVSTFMNILNTISNSLDTNLTTKQMLSFYSVGKDIIKKSLSSEQADLINIQQLYLAGNSQMIYDERMRMVLYNYIPNNNSKKDIVQAMKENLGLVQITPIKYFSFSINSPFEKEIIGKGPYRSASLYTLLPDFTGDTEEAARAAAARLGITVTFVGNSGTVVSQSYPASKRVDLITSPLVLTLSGATEKDDKDKEKENNKDKDEDEENQEDNQENNEGNNNNNDNENSNESDQNTPNPEDPIIDNEE